MKQMKLICKIVVCFFIMSGVGLADLWLDDGGITITDDNDDVKIAGELQIGPYASVGFIDYWEGTHLSAFTNTDGARVSLLDDVLLLQAGPNSDVMLIAEEEGVWIRNAIQVESEGALNSTYITTHDAGVNGVWSILSNGLSSDGESLNYVNDGSAVILTNQDIRFVDFDAKTETINVNMEINGQTDEVTVDGDLKAVGGIDMSAGEKITSDGDICIGYCGY